jgi:hypothetical protein
MSIAEIIGQRRDQTRRDKRARYAALAAHASTGNLPAKELAELDQLMHELGVSLKELDGVVADLDELRMLEAQEPFIAARRDDFAQARAALAKLVAQHHEAEMQSVREIQASNVAGTASEWPEIQAAGQHLANEYADRFIAARATLSEAQKAADAANTTAARISLLRKTHAAFLPVE